MVAGIRAAATRAAVEAGGRRTLRARREDHPAVDGGTTHPHRSRPPSVSRRENSIDSCVLLQRNLLQLRHIGQRGGADRESLRRHLESATREARRLRSGADEVLLAYLAAVEAVLDFVRDAATIGDWPSVERAADLVHNVPQLIINPEGWSHRFFRAAFIDGWARSHLSKAMQQLEAVLDRCAPTPSAIAAKIVEAHTDNPCWSTTRAAIEHAGQELDLDEEEIALRVFHLLPWPEVDHEDHLEIVGIAMSGDEALWRLVVGGGTPP